MRSAIGSGTTLIFLARGPGSDPPATTTSIRVAEATDADVYARDVGTDSPRTFVDRLDPTTRCYLALHDRRIVHATWVTSSAAWIGEIRRYFVVPERSLYIYESFTSPDVRGRGIYPEVLRHIAADARREGSTELWIGVGDTNAPSLRAIDKAGFARAFDISARRRWGRVEIRSTAGPRAAVADEVIREGWPDIPMVR